MMEAATERSILCVVMAASQIRHSRLSQSSLPTFGASARTCL